MDKSSPSDPLRQRNSDVESGSINGISGTKEESDDSLWSLETRRSVGFDVFEVGRDVFDTDFDSAGEEAVSGCVFSLDCCLALKADSTYEGEMMYGAWQPKSQ